MRLRRVVSLLAVAGLLLQAMVIVRHNITMLATLVPGAAQSLSFDVGETGANPVCHQSGTLYLAGLPGVSEKYGSPGTKKPCPVCMGMCAVTGLAPPDQFVELRLTLRPHDTRWPLHTSRSSNSDSDRRPPGRAPPSIA